MKMVVYSLLLALPLSASAAFPLINNPSTEDAGARALIESEINDFDVVRDQALLEKAIDMNPFSLLTDGLIHLTTQGSTHVPFNVADLENPNDWKRQFRYVVWVNRNHQGPTGQTMQVWDHGKRIMAVPISTGAPGHGTPTGYFTVQFLSRNHRSSLYNNTPMPFAIFFNGHIALHERPPGTQKQIGKPASKGCIRITRNPDGSKPAEKLFDLVEATGRSNLIPQFTRAGRPIIKTDGSMGVRRGWSTLIIVEHR